MKSLLIAMTLLTSLSGHAFEEDMCEAVHASEVEKCEVLVSENKFEMVPVELCQILMGSGEMMECYEAIKNKAYIYSDVLACASLHRYGIPGCMEEVGTPMQE